MELDTLTRHCDTTFSSASDCRGMTAEVNGSLRRILAVADLIYAFEYEALGKNPVFLDGRVERSRFLSGETQSRAAVHRALKGSSLWQSEDAGLSGAISIKSGCAVQGAVRDSLVFLEEWTEDYEKTPESLFVRTGMSLALDRMNLSLAHLAKLITNRLLRLTNPLFSGLPALLSQTPEALLTLQEKAVGIDTQISQLSTPSGLYRQAILNERVDLPQGFVYALRTTQKITGLLDRLLAIDALNCMKVFELRKTKPDGEQTAWFYEQMQGYKRRQERTQSGILNPLKEEEESGWGKLFEDSDIQQIAVLIENLIIRGDGGGDCHSYSEK